MLKQEVMSMLSIGQFSKTCMVTVKALRHYDKIGLIKPAFVNPETGYREYSEDQIPLMLLINKLKYYGFALSEIKDMISCQDVILSSLMKQRDTLWKSVHETMDILSELSAHVRELERTGNIMSYQNDYKIEIVKTADGVLAAFNAPAHFSVLQYHPKIKKRLIV